LHPFTTEIKREIKISTLKTVSDDYESISKESVVEISWWLENIKSVNGKDIRPKHVDMWIETDASTQGWGCKFNDKYAGGRWEIFISLLISVVKGCKKNSIKSTNNKTNERC
jgi:hypothetical protein